MTSSTAPSPTHRWPLRRVLRIAVVGLAVLLIVAVAGATWLAHRVRTSLPVLDGEVTLAGLEGPVTIERDRLGVPTLTGGSRVDLARALGFLHGQERFFQMDLFRRQSAGELAELFGAAALPSDRRLRIHRFRHRAVTALEALPEAERALLVAYVDGVNAGLEALEAPPPEYLLLRTDPAPWSAEDTFLVLYAMYLDLQDEEARTDAARELLLDRLGPEMAAFLDPPGSVWDAPLEGEALPEAPIPPPEAFDLRRAGAPVGASDVRETVHGPGAPPEDRPEGESLPEGAVGSNNFAVSGALTTHGGAILAGDMHLGIRLPNTWYRASLVFPDPSGDGLRRATGVTLPGTPTLVAGSNGRVAWAFTNSYGDWFDLVELVPGPAEGTYRTATGVEAIERHEETLRVQGGEPETLVVEETRFGPIVRTDHEGDRQAVRWVAHSPRGANLALVGLETANTLEEALAVGHRAGTPAQNLMLADDAGRIAWTILGPVPRRSAGTGPLPIPSDHPALPAADGADPAWGDWLTPEEVPEVVDPATGYLWTANSRTMGGARLALLGDGGYALGARARQIRDGLARLAGRGAASEEDLLAIQLDDRALFLARWRELLLERVLTPEAVAEAPLRQEARELVDAWGGRATPESAGYRLVREIRAEVAREVFTALTARAAEDEEAIGRIYLSRFREEAPLWRLVTETPGHLLPPEHESWEALLAAATDRTLERMAEGGRPLASRTWGEANVARVRHPLSGALPGFLARRLDAPDRPLPGDTRMPRVQGEGFGASQRMVVSPGREAEGIFHMPGGQSGHFLSPFYLAGHDAWAAGRPTPFLPGATEHTLELVPAS